MHTSVFTRYSRSIGITVCLAGGVLFAQQSFAANDGNAGTLSPQDQKFAKDAAIGGLYEVQAGQLAAQKATSPAVKEMGEHIASDHAKGNAELKSIAQTKGIELPTQLDVKHQSKLERLSKLSGAEFDRTYSKMMVSDHKEDIKKFQKQAKSGNDADLKQFAAKTVPILDQHLSMAQSKMKAVQTPNADTGTGQTTPPSGQKPAAQ